jgi:Protein of unknown function (DUF2924)
MVRGKHEPANAGAGTTAPADSAVDLANLSEQVAALSSLSLDQIRVRWRKLFRRPAPAHLARYLLFRVIAYRIQANALGDLDKEAVRFLDAVAADWQKRRAAGETNSKRPPPIPPVPAKRSLKVGTILAREYAGELQRVIVLEDGFSWNGTPYRSLSEVARAITGTNWNGPRFFGLRDKTRAALAGDRNLGARRET